MLEFVDYKAKLLILYHEECIRAFIPLDTLQKMKLRIALLLLCLTPLNVRSKYLLVKLEKDYKGKNANKISEQDIRSR